MVVKTECEIVPGSSTPAAARSTHRRSTEGVIDSHVQIVAVAGGGGDEVKVLEVSRQVRAGNVLQQASRNGGGRSRPRTGLRGESGNDTPGESCVRRGVEDLYLLAFGRTGSVPNATEISLAFLQSRDGRKLVEGILAPLAVVIDKEKRLAATVIDAWDVERTSDGAPETILQVSRLGWWLAGEFIRSRIQRGIADAVVDGTMGMVDVEAAASCDGHGPSATSATKAASPKSSSTSTTAKSASAAEAATLRASIGDALLQFVSTHGIQGVRPRAGDGD